MTGRAGRRLGGREATTARIEGAYALAVGLPDKPAPAGWTWRLLTDLARLESGHTPSRRRADYWGGDIPWIGIRDATGNHGRTIHQTNETTNELGIANSAARILPANTVCLSRTASVGYVVVMGRPMATSQDFVNWVCDEELDYRFLKYVLLAEGNTLLRFASGSVHQTIYFPEVKAFHIALPQIWEQQAISDLLGALDDKIELNRRMNKTLEEMGQTIFRDWFVDFGPVRRKLAGDTDPVSIIGGLTPDPARAAELAALFPEAFEEDGRPQGWAPATLADLATHCKGSVTPLAHAAEEFEHYSLPAFDSGQEPAIDLGASIKSNKTPVPAGAVLLSKLNPEIPRIWLPNPATGRQQIASTEFLIFQPLSGVGRGLLYFLFRDPTVRQILAGMVTGTSKSHQRISPPALMKTSLLVSCSDALEAFDQMVEPLLQRVLSLRAESRTLAETRDYLLPRLMSGTVRVGGALQRDTAA